MDKIYELEREANTIVDRARLVDGILNGASWQDVQRVLSLVVHKAGHTLIIDGLPIPAEE